MRLSQVPFDELLPWPLTPLERSRITGVDPLTSPTDRARGHETAWYVDRTGHLGAGSRPEQVLLSAGRVVRLDEPALISVAVSGLGRSTVRVGARFEIDCWCRFDHVSHRIAQFSHTSDSTAGFVSAWRTLAELSTGWRERPPRIVEWRRTERLAARPELPQPTASPS